MTTYAIKVQNTMRPTNRRYSTEGPVTLLTKVVNCAFTSLLIVASVLENIQTRIKSLARHYTLQTMQMMIFVLTKKRKRKRHYWSSEIKSMSLPTTAPTAARGSTTAAEAACPTRSSPWAASIHPTTRRGSTPLPAPPAHRSLTCTPATG